MRGKVCFLPNAFHPYKAKATDIIKILTLKKKNDDGSEYLLRHLQEIHTHCHLSP